jgi:hypothetical protein
MVLTIAAAKHTRQRQAGGCFIFTIEYVHVLKQRIALQSKRMRAHIKEQGMHFV